MSEALTATVMLCLLTAVLRVTLPIISDGLLTAVVTLFPRKGL